MEASNYYWVLGVGSRIEAPGFSLSALWRSWSESSQTSMALKLRTGWITYFITLDSDSEAFIKDFGLDPWPFSKLPVHTLP